ncbi:MAG: TonB-dependent receptor [Bacteroidota bacterium]
MNRCIVFIAILFFPVIAIAQNYSYLDGKVLDKNSEPIPNANVYLSNRTSIGVTTDFDGNFSLRYPESIKDTLVISHMGYENRKISLSDAKKQEELVVRLEGSAEDIEQVQVSGDLRQDRSLIRIEKKAFELMPVTGGEVESIIKKMPGVSSRSELSYQYSVRGGNYDENLIYVNGIKIYRPITVSSGKQEGLSFLNSDMVSSVNFSAGGFESRYGEKMSSVLDIKYEEPKEFEGNVDMSLLGGALHLQDISENGKFSYNMGLRYKSNSYLLNSLDVDADYRPKFYDLQTFLTYSFTDDLDLNFLGNYSLNRYRFVPHTRETSFGTVQNSLNLNIYYEGQEIDKFENYTGALSLNYRPSSDLSLKFIGSAFRTSEEETYDILGEYYLNELDKSVDSESYGDSIMNIGVGGFLEHARNSLDGNVYSFSHKGSWINGLHNFRWGLKVNHNIFEDQMNEWKMVDSAGYSIPYSDSFVNLYSSVNADNNLSYTRLKGYFQDTYNFTTATAKWHINAGIRFTYGTLIHSLLVSPRASISFEPKTLENWEFHLSSGYYYQPPFFKELKMKDGSLNKNIDAQKSIHFVLGSEYDFMAWGRPFKYTADMYYKKLDDLIPYKINNVRVDYLGENRATGYAAGVDMKVNGEFVEGVESWASLSLMKTEEKMKDDYFINDEGEREEMGYYPRPTDQRFTFSLYFQDYIPNNPTYKMLLSLHYGSRIPFYPPQTERRDQVFRMPEYKRVDIGFSKLITGRKKDENASGPFKYIKSLWLGVEVFNLMDINNTISYQWVKTVGNQQGQSGEYAVPNYLTSRRFNLKLKMKF